VCRSCGGRRTLSDLELSALQGCYSQPELSLTNTTSHSEQILKSNVETTWPSPPRTRTIGQMAMVPLTICLWIGVLSVLG
jgi:hypothetical protein